MSIWRHSQFFRYFLHTSSNVNNFNIFSDPALVEFQEIKLALSHAVKLSNIVTDCELCLALDVSFQGIDVVLQHSIDGDWKFIYFFSWKFSYVETKYSTFECERPLIYSANYHIHQFLAG